MRILGLNQDILWTRARSLLAETRASGRKSGLPVRLSPVCPVGLNEKVRKRPRGGAGLVQGLELNQ